MSEQAEAGGPTANDLRQLRVFVVRLGAAMNAAGQTVYEVQARFARVAHTYQARAARISAFPTFPMVTMGRGEPASLELTAVTTAPRLDQIARLDRLVREAEAGGMASASRAEACVSAPATGAGASR